MNFDFDMEVRKTRDISIIGLSGDLDGFTCGKLQEAVSGLLDNENPLVVINLENVTYIDSYGLGTLVGSLASINELQGGLAISSANQQVEKVLSVTGLSKLFDLYNDDEEALMSLESRFTESGITQMAA
jgi:anti-sigma B factor antagonist